MTWPKLLFLFNRYMVPVAMLLRTNGNWSSTFCVRNYLSLEADFSGIALPVLSNTVSPRSRHVGRTGTEFKLTVVSSSIQQYSKCDPTD